MKKQLKPLWMATVEATGKSDNLPAYWMLAAAIVAILFLLSVE